MVTIKPLVALSGDEVQSLLIALGADPRNMGFTREEYTLFHKRSPTGRNVLSELQSAAREAQRDAER